MAQALTNTQLEILKAFSFNLSNDELIEFKDVIAAFFAEKAIKEANKVWKKNEWTDDDVDKILSAKMRKKDKS